MDESVLTFNTSDLVVSDEAQWVKSKKPMLMQVWRALRKIMHDVAPEEMFLDEASFAIFASFVHRWTDTEYEEVDDDDDVADDTSENAEL